MDRLALDPFLRWLLFLCCTWSCARADYILPARQSCSNDAVQRTFSRTADISPSPGLLAQLMHVHKTSQFRNKESSHSCHHECLVGIVIWCGQTARIYHVFQVYNKRNSAKKDI